MRNAENWDSIKVGSADLLRDHPDVAWHAPQNIHLINCDQILVGLQPVDQYYENVVKSRIVPLIWWRDTTASYYAIKRGDLPLKVAVDGYDDNTTDYPDFKSISGGVYFGELNLVLDADEINI